jgi:methyl coenzyme M reductase alpha subunit
MAKAKEPTLKGLIIDLNNLGNSKNNKLAVLGLQLYAEHYVNEIVMEQMKDCAREEVRKHLSFPQKLRIVKNLGIIDETMKRVLETLNSIRDGLVHELMFSSEEINEKLKFAKLGFDYSWSIKVRDKIKDFHLLNLEKEYREKIPNKYNQLVISSVVIIGILYHNLRVIRGENSDQFIDVQFERKNATWTVNLLVKEFTV